MGPGGAVLRAVSTQFHPSPPLELSIDSSLHMARWRFARTGQGRLKKTPHDNLALLSPPSSSNSRQGFYSRPYCDAAIPSLSPVLSLFFSCCSFSLNVTDRRRQALSGTWPGDGWSPSNYAEHGPVAGASDKENLRRPQIVGSWLAANQAACRRRNGRDRQDMIDTPLAHTLSTV